MVKKVTESVKKPNLFDSRSDKCLLCKKKKRYKVYCKKCFMNYFERKIRKEIRLGKAFSRDEIIILVSDNSIISDVMVAVLTQILDTSRYEYSIARTDNIKEFLDLKIKTGFDAKLVVPFVSDFFSALMIKSFFDNVPLETMLKFDNRIIFPMNVITYEECLYYGECKNLKKEFTKSNFKDIFSAYDLNDVFEFIQVVQKDNVHSVHSLKKSHDVINDVI